MNVTAQVNYHVQSDAQQAFQFDVGGKSGVLISPELEATEICVRDIRNQQSALNFNRDGIAFINSDTQVQSFEHNNEWQTQYEAELQNLLAKEIGAKEVIVFDHTVRVDDPNAERRPARNVHNDYSRGGAEQRLIDLLGDERAAEFKAGHFGFVNVWRPVERTIKSSPLGFIHPESVKPEDWMTIDLIYPDRLGQILGLAKSSRHKWFYMSDMQTDEVAIFNIFDNSGRPQLAHSALDLATDKFAQTPRKSIESRTLVRYR